jgi:hypothetical protein
MCNFRFWRMGLIGCLVLVCSCATRGPVGPGLPAEVAFKEDRGSDERVYLTLHLADGKPLLFIADTGATGTVLDKSLEPQLGKRLATTRVNYPFFGKTNLNVYAAPKLYLGDTPLKIGRRIMTDDLSRLSNSPPFMGVLGMDCLRYYCIQLDPAAHKIRFLNPEAVAGTNWGEAFPLTFSWLGHLPTMHTNLFWPANTGFGVDTGCKFDAVLKPGLFRREVRRLPDQRLGQFDFERRFTNFAGAYLHEEFLPGVILNGEVCTNFVLEEWPGENLIGLRYLARHEVTLDFPGRTMYLRAGGADSFASRDSITNAFSAWDCAVYSFTAAAVRHFLRLTETGKLPGLVQADEGRWTFSADFNAGDCQPGKYPIALTFSLRKNDDASQYRYEVVQKTKEGAPSLKRAWRTDKHGHVVEEYRVP